MEEIPPYTFFANVYDFMMRHVNYEFWARYILNSLPNKEIYSVLDLGCGTGELLFYFPNHWKKVGLDRSEAMLEVAKRRNPRAHFVQGDMSHFILNEKFDLILCTHDAANYLLTLSELRSFFYHVKMHLSRDGYFFFDLNSEYNLKTVFHQKTIRKVFQNIAIEWKNEYKEDEKIIYSHLTFQQGGKTWSEKHLQKYHSLEDVKTLLGELELQLLKLGSDYEKWNITPKTYLFTFLVRNKFA